ncbi:MULTISPECIES: SMI1/KNR4 family protein [Actinosynnema]|uniref:SMI1/KNR4 family protein n=1 Tax=Actinosynnema TaxID=40566 RepID=UPI0020A5B3DC|nr:SMI1/KNR4 family protein [Actinosynnema pretiosum]MCP2092576.1 SMI1 / KNR4 family (SUKH-1) [Actinosynnema pretiosum]
MLGPELIAALERAVARYGRGTPVPPERLPEVEARLGIALDPDYARFAERFGACFVGVPVHAFGGSALLEDVDVVALTLRFRDDGWPGVGNALVFGVDPAGNPLFLDPAGKVRTTDHDLGDGGTRVLADGFAAFLAEHVHD